MYRQFNIQQFYVLPTQCIYVFCVDMRTDSDYFPINFYGLVYRRVRNVKSDYYFQVCPSVRVQQLVSNKTDFQII